MLKIEGWLIIRDRTGYNDILKGRESEFTHTLLKRTRKTIDFSKPAYTVERQDSEEIRQKILSISYSEWKKMGFSKGTLHYMKKNSEAEKPFTLNAHVRERLEMWKGC